ncbi:PREDICTED: uncharacterized protein LOC107339964 [Acropora digitifera]|uniref:uncharacterized protein LOC107339964 n=1 Tax=Acropora digitifera TaxID=70779 RepID=UPI00077AC39E|nr:PREDICTED: uncharacterized protein LOC107339964 [Acropora digitifera]
MADESHRVSEEMVRSGLQRINPDGVALRWLQISPRRSYGVPGPLSLWHIDGNHKLIRWRLVIHGGVDGFSRIPVYLHCSSINRADTVSAHFLAAVNEYGLPSGGRSDIGGENVGVSLFMLQHPERGPNRGSMICGPSVHNQRIEGLWRDVFSGVLYIYYQLFYHLEDNGVLEPTDRRDLFCLHESTGHVSYYVLLYTSWMVLHYALEQFHQL